MSRFGEGPVPVEGWRWMMVGFPVLAPELIGMQRRRVDTTNAFVFGVRCDVLVRTTWPGHEPDLFRDLVWERA